MEVVYKNTLNQVSVISTITELVNASTETQKRIAGAKFQDLFFKELWNRCLEVCKNSFRYRKDYIQIAEDVFSDAIITAFDEIRNFKLPKEVNNDEKAKKIVMAWLSTIVNNRILKQRGILKQDKKNLDSYKEFLKSELIIGAESRRETEKSYDPKKMKKVWNELCELSKDILHLSHQHECFPCFNQVTREFEKNKKHIPKEEKKKLLEKHQTTDDNYRQVKKRAFDTIFSCVINPNLIK
jgi:DNA-directed RNA polymerase specialized sigma24 family protein